MKKREHDRICAMILDWILETNSDLRIFITLRAPEIAMRTGLSVEEIIDVLGPLTERINRRKKGRS